MFTVVLSLLAIATIAGLLLRRLYPTLRLQDFFHRLTAWWIVTGTMLLIVLAVRHDHGAVFALLVLLALAECKRALWPARKGLLAVAVVWTLFGLGHLQAWLWQAEPATLLSFCWVILLTQLNDIAQYFAGKAFGRHRIVPSISPNKTSEGLAGGVVFSMVASGAATPLLLPLTTGQSLGLGLLIGAGGFAGDILYSWLKRRAGIKDFGTLLPGQGGVLDRLDSATVTAPLVYWYLHTLAS